MPYTFNGIGTGYSGKKNIHSEFSECSHCGHSDYLLSYDTILYFVIFFLPVFPLGKKRVLNHCPSCQTHNIISLKEWSKLKADDIQSAAIKFKESPRNPHAAIELLNTIIAYQEENTFNVTGPVIKKIFNGSAEVMSMLGMTYGVFKNVTNEEACYRAALAAEDTPDHKNQLASSLILNGKPDEAVQYIEHIFKNKEIENIGLIYLLIEGFQASARHKEALEIIDKLIDSFPEFENDKNIIKYRKASFKGLKSNKKIISNSFKNEIKKTKEPKSISNLFPKLIAPAILLIIIGIYFFNSMDAAMNRSVHLINGINKTYRVSLNNNTYKLNPNQRLRVIIREGDIAIKVLNPELTIEDQHCSIKTKLFTRIFSTDLFIINPDRTAVFLWDKTVYRNNPDPNSVNPHKLISGRLLYHFKDIDYHFTDFPDTLKISTPSVEKTRINQLNGQYSALQIVDFMQSDKQFDQALNFAERRLNFVPLQKDLLRYYISSAPPEKVLELFEKHLDDRPVLTDWHRYYQQYVEETGGGLEALINRYRIILSKEPENSTLMYLLGRILLNTSESESYYLKSIQSNPPSAYSYHALAWHTFNSGNFRKAFDLSSKAVSLDPENQTFLELYESELMSLNQYDQLLKLIDRKIKTIGNSGDLVKKRVVALTALNRHNEASRTIESYIKELDSQGNPEAEKWKHYLNSIAAYIRGDIVSFNNHADKYEGFLFSRALLANRLEDAEKCLKNGNTSPFDHLLLAGLANISGDTVLSRNEFKKSLEMITSQSKTHRELKSYLEGQTPGPAALLNTGIRPYEKCIVALYLGTKHQKNKKQFFDLARKFNFDRNPQYISIKRVIQ